MQESTGSIPTRVSPSTVTLPSIQVDRYATVLDDKLPHSQLLDPYEKRDDATHAADTAVANDGLIRDTDPALFPPKGQILLPK